MYRSYTQIFRIFGAIIIFLQISKVAALFKIQKISKLTILSLSLTDDPAPLSATQRERTAALPSPVGQNAPAVMLR